MAARAAEAMAVGRAAVARAVEQAEDWVAAGKVEAPAVA